MSGVIRFSMKRQKPKEGPSWEPPPLTPSEKLGVQRSLGLQPDRRREQRVFDPSLNRAYNALRVVQARAKHKPNNGLDAKAAKQAARELRRG